jgi:hypothetical protein
MLSEIDHAAQPLRQHAAGALGIIDIGSAG